MRYHWVKDRATQKQFLVYWDKGENNLADYSTKHHPSWHCMKMRPIVLNNISNSKFETGKGVLLTPTKGLRGPHTVTVISTVKTQIQILVHYLKQFNQRTFNNVLIKLN